MKSNLGHLEAAAGVAGLIKAVLAVQRGHIPPNLDFTQPNPLISIRGTAIESRCATDRLATDKPSAAGGGVVVWFWEGDAHVVLEQGRDVVGGVVGFG